MSQAEEKKLCELSSKYIFNETAGSMLLLLNSFMEQKITPNEVIDSLKNNDEIKQIREKINGCIFLLEDTLSQNEKRTEALDKSIELKKQLVGIYNVVFGYFTKLENTAEMISDEVAVRKYREDQSGKDKQIELSLFYADCAGFLKCAKDQNDFDSRARDLFRCVPMRMTRQRYFGIIEKELKKAFADSSKEELSNAFAVFKRACAPELMPEYGKYFTDISSAIKEKEGIKTSELSDEKLQSVFEDISQLLDTVREVEDYFQLTLSDINSLIILFFMGYTFEELTEGEPGYADCWHKVCEIMENPEDEAFNDSLFNALDGYIEPLMDKAGELNKKILDLISKADLSQMSDETLKSISTETFVRSCFYEDINEAATDYPDTQGKPKAQEWELDEAIEDFIDYSRQYLYSLAPDERKYAMSALMSALPVHFSFDEIMAYIKEGIDNAAFYEQRLLIVDKTGTVFDNRGFNYSEEDEDECGCGHDHHHHDHGDECGCGHDHNHEH